MKTLHLRWMAAALTAAVCFTVFLAAQTHPAQAQAVNCADTAATGIPQAECEVMMAEIAPLVPEWEQGNPPCLWASIYCENGHVLAIHSPNAYDTSVPTAFPDLSALTHLEYIALSCDCPGDFPAWIAESSTLKTVDIGYSQLSGTLPDLSTMAALEELNLHYNDFSGPLPNISMLPNLKVLTLRGNNFSGTLHTGVTASTTLEILDLRANALSGTLPDMSSMISLAMFIADSNQFSGPLPALPPNVVLISLVVNHLTGAIPVSYGDLEGRYLYLSGNMLTGEVPSSLNTVNLYLNFNALTATEPATIAWLTDPAYGAPDFFETQTLPPTGVSVSNVTHESANVAWTPILYTADTGSYEVGLSTTTGSGYVFNHATANKLASSISLSGLTSNTTYYGVIRTVTQPHIEPPIPNGPDWSLTDNPNTVTSLNSAEFSFTTGFDPDVLNCADTAATGIPQAECEILNAEIAPVLEEWERNQPPCTWTVVYCTNNHVTSISMYNDDIHIGPHTYELLAVPDLSGLTQLGTLSLQNVGLTGPVPAWIAESSSLQLVNLSSNELSGTIPDLSGMTSLYALTFRGNNLEGALPAIPPNLEALHLSNNRLSGNIPSSYANLVGGLELNGNKLTGEVPAEFVDTIDGMPMTPDLNYNALTATTPGLVTLLNQSDPQFSLTQTVPPAGIAVSNVTHNSATLSWTPIAFTDHAGAYEVGLSTTSGSGYTFSHSTANKSASGISLGGLTPNTTYYAVVRTVTQPHDNYYFRLANPNTVTSLNSAEFTFTTGFDPAVLNCANTAATGIPQSECEALVAEIGPILAENVRNTSPCTWRGIRCEDGHVTEVSHPSGILPLTAIPNLSALTHLEVFQINCNCTGSFPDWVTAWPQLKVLQLGGNRLSGQLPDLSAMTSLEVLGLAYNDLTGSTPDVSTMSNLLEFSIRENNFSGTLHPSITASTRLKYLSVSFNALSGTLPDMTSLTSLETFDAQFNQFSGSLPAFAPSVRFIHLASNRFTGEIPASYGDLPDLFFLTLGGNMLTGEIPDNLRAEWPYLQYNALTATDAGLIALLNSRNPAFFTTQTLPPAGISVSNVTSGSAAISWTPIAYGANTGAYEIGLSTTSGSGYVFSHSTADKLTSGITLSNLDPETTYYAVIRTVTQPHGEDLDPEDFAFTRNPNTVTSLNSAEFSFTTLVDPVSAPVLLSPAANGTVRGTNSPVLSWLPNPAGEGVTAYRLLLKNDATGATVLKQNISAATCAAGCAVDLSSLVPQIDLALGVYNWQVTATGSLGTTRSLKQRFSVVKPDAPVITAPLGTVSDPQPDLMWTVNPDDLNTRFKLKLTGVKSGVIFKKTVSGVCSGAACAIGLDVLAGGPYLLNNDSYTLIVTAVNETGNRKSTSTFKVRFPAPAVSLAPSGGIL